jgi:hypothetical protein
MCSEYFDLILSDAINVFRFTLCFNTAAVGPAHAFIIQPQFLHTI